GQSRAQRRLPRRQRQVDRDVAAVHAITPIRGQADDQIQVAGGRVTPSWTAPAGPPDALSPGDSRPGLGVAAVRAPRPGQREGTPAAVVGVLDAQRELGLAVGPPEAPARPGAGRTPATEQAAQQVLEVDALFGELPLAAERRPGRAANSAEWGT